jgi:hypothetical protein
MNRDPDFLELMDQVVRQESMILVLIFALITLALLVAIPRDL